MNNKLSLLYRKDGTQKFLSSLIAILLGMVFGSILITIVGLTSSDIGSKGILDAIKLTFLGLFSTGTKNGALTFGFNPSLFGDMLFRATPLIMTGLSVAVSQKTGLFNIGAAGQYLMGTMAALMIALSIPTTSVPPAVVWLLAFLGGIVAGALWGSIPGMLKAFLNINEVLACIMTNWIAANLVTLLFDVSKFSVFSGPQTSAMGDPIVLEGSFKNLIESTKSAYIYKTTYNNVATPKLGLDKLLPGSQANAGILIAIAIAILVYIVIHKTTFGYQLKACGANRHAARYAGIQDKRNIVFSMAIAGGLAGAGAALYWLSGNTEFAWQTYQSLPAVGFNGIPVALLAINNPIGVIFSGALMAMLNIIGTRLTALTAYNEYITDVIIAVIVYLSAFALMIRMWLSGGRKSKKKAIAEQPAAPAAKPDAEKPVPAVSEAQKGGTQQ
ncbi:MAG: ABC transporter permease [Oscillospiraceae bacterium]|nr:ABC transporter permease [Oscillospiraceae bacterium]